MIRRPITPRLRSRRGQDEWYVNVPLDLIGPNTPRRRAFSSEKEAVTFAKGLANARLSLAGEFLKLPQFEQAALLRAIQDLGAGGVVAAVRAWQERAPQSQKAISELAKECIEAKRQSGVRANSLRVLTDSLKSFARSCGKPIGAVAAADVDQWLKNDSWKPKTKKHHLINLSSMFAWAVRRGSLTKNPCEGVERPRVAYKQPDILTVAQIKKLLEACQNHDAALLGFICPILFGGLRVDESRRLTKANFKNGIIDIGGEQTKLNVRRAFAIQPVLAAWLKVSGVQIGWNRIEKRMANLREISGVKMPPNCLRHSCASYWLELLGSKDAARMLGHSEATLFNHYAAKVTQEEAKAFLALRPQ